VTTTRNELVNIEQILKSNILCYLKKNIIISKCTISKIIKYMKGQIQSHDGTEWMKIT